MGDPGGEGAGGVRTPAGDSGADSVGLADSDGEGDGDGDASARTVLVAQELSSTVTSVLVNDTQLSTCVPAPTEESTVSVTV